MTTWAPASRRAGRGSCRAVAISDSRDKLAYFAMLVRIMSQILPPSKNSLNLAICFVDVYLLTGFETVSWNLCGPGHGAGQGPGQGGGGGEGQPGRLAHKSRTQPFIQEEVETEGGEVPRQGDPRPAVEPGHALLRCGPSCLSVSGTVPLLVPDPDEADWYLAARTGSGAGPATGPGAPAPVLFCLTEGDKIWSVL